MKIKIAIFVSALVVLSSVAYLLRMTGGRDDSIGTASHSLQLQSETRSVPLPNATPVQAEPVPHLPDAVTTTQASDVAVSPSETEEADAAIASSLPELSDLLSFETFQAFLLETNTVDVSELFTSNVLEQMLATTGRNEANLIAAHILSGQMSYLEEALGMSPDCALGYALEIAKHITAETPPEELEQWISVLKEAEPDNSVAYYQAAYKAFQLNDLESALASFVEATSKPDFNDHTAAAKHALEQFLIDSGISEGPAKAIAFEKIVSAYGDQQRLISGLVRKIDEMHIMFAEQNNQEDGIALAQHTAALGARLANSQYRDTVLTDLVGIAIERKALEREASLQTEAGNESRLTEIAQRLSAIEQETLSIKAAVQCPVNISQILTTRSEAEVMEYFDLITSHGEYAAWLWAVENVVNPKKE
jgi:hypothetical protein